MFECDFPTALRQLADEQRLSLRAAAAASREYDPEGRGLTQAHLSTVLSGKRPATGRVMEALAGVFKVDPCAFVEYRAATVRDAFDPARASFERVHGNIRLLKNWLDHERNSLGETLGGCLDGRGGPGARPAAVFECDFPTALRQLADGHGRTISAVAAATRNTDPGGQGLTHAYLSIVLHGKQPATRRLMEAVAGVFGIDPCAFVEYRAATIRDAFNPTRTPFDRVQGNIQLLKDWLDRENNRLTAMLHLCLNGQDQRTVSRRTY